MTREILGSPLCWMASRRRANSQTRRSLGRYSAWFMLVTWTKPWRWWLGVRLAIRRRCLPRAARRFRHETPAGNIGINIGVAAPMAYFPFSGWKDSFFGIMHAQGRDAIEFYTEKKIVEIGR